MSLFGTSFLSAQTSLGEAPEDKGNWAIQTCRFPATDLAQGFKSAEGIEYRAPGLPSAFSSDEQAMAFIQHSDLAVTQYLKALEISLPEGSLAVFDPANLTLALRTNSAGQSSVAAAAKALMEKWPKNIRFVVSLVSAEENLARQVVNETLGLQDHSAALAKLQALPIQDPVRHEGVRQIDSLSLETRSGVSAYVQSGETREHGEVWGGNADGIQVLSADTRNVGSRLKIDPVIGPDGKSVDVNYWSEHHYLPPQDHLELVQVPGKTPAQLSLTDFFTAEVTSAQTWLAGQSRLIGVWDPEMGDGNTGSRILLAFARAEIIPLLPEEEHTAWRLLIVYGGRVRATPIEEVGQGTSQQLATRRFVVPRSSSMLSFPGGAGRSPKGEPEERQARTLEILQGQGVQFPDGSSATFNRFTGELFVRNTVQNLEKVQEFMESLIPKIPENICFTLHLVQGEGSFLRSVIKSSLENPTRTSAWVSVKDAVDKGGAKWVQILWLGGRSGSRSSSGSGREFLYFPADRRPPVGASVAEGGGKDGADEDQPSTVFPNLEKLGLHLEIEAILPKHSPRLLEVDYRMSFHYASPRFQPVISGSKTARLIELEPGFRRVITESSSTMVPGSTRVVGFWKPQGTPEFDNAIAQMALLRADVENGKTTQE